MTASNPWFTIPKPNTNAPLRLFCFTYAGGGASVFHTWGRDLPPALELCALQLPGRESRFREPLLTSSQALLDALSEAILPWLDRPYAFFGHSMGGLVGFELARALARRGAPTPSAFFVSGRRAPGAVHRPRRAFLHTLSDADLLEEIVRMDGMDPVLLANAEWMSLLLPIMRADFAVCETHTQAPGSPLDCPIVAFGGDRDHNVAPSQLDPWRAETSGSFRVRVFSGGHFYFKQVWPEFARELSAELWPLIKASVAVTT